MRAVVVQAAGRVPSQSSLVRSWMICVPTIFASITLLATYWFDLAEPEFPGDSGIRLEHSGSLIVHYGSRVWLPFIQLHIFVLQLLSPALWVYKIIPLFYEVVFFLSFSLCAYRILPKTVSSILLTSAILVSLVGSRPMEFVQLNLYQEIPLLAVTYLLFSFLLRPSNSASVVIVLSFCGMLIRETFWIYYCAALVCAALLSPNCQQYTRRQIAMLLSPLLVPLVWLLSTNQGLFVAAETSKKALTFSVVSARIERLYMLFEVNSLLVPLLLLGISGVMLFLQQVFLKQRISSVVRTYPTPLFVFTIFSLVSLAVVYGHIIIVDPFEKTVLNRRMAIPFLSHLPLWWLLQWQTAASKTMLLRVFVRSCILASIVLLLR